MSLANGVEINFDNKLPEKQRVDLSKDLTALGIGKLMDPVFAGIIEINRKDKDIALTMVQEVTDSEQVPPQVIQRCAVVFTPRGNFHYTEKIKNPSGQFVVSYQSRDNLDSVERIKIMLAPLTHTS